MGLFGESSKTGGLMDVIRCDEPSYLIWKWHPAGSQNKNNRENAIRWGSSLRVKEGEVAVFVYAQKDGSFQDYIEGPFDSVIETGNFPVLTDIVGLAYDGSSPFQAEIYFINLAQIIQIPFAVPYFDLFDPRFLDFGVPAAVRGKLTFRISDYRQFVKLHRLIDFNLDSFQNEIRDALSRYVKFAVSNIPQEKGIPVVQIERKIDYISTVIEEEIQERFKADFGVNVTAVDINAIEIDKTSDGYQQLKAVTQNLSAATAQAQTEVEIKNLHDIQRINAENAEESLRIQREEAQYAQHKQTQSSYFDAYQLEQQSTVGIAGAEALGNMAANGATEISEGGAMNPAAMMTGMAMGGVIGQNISGIMNGMMGKINNPQTGNSGSFNTMPPIPPITAYHVAQNGKPSGPFDLTVLSQMVGSGTFTGDSLVWKEGMAEWVKAKEVQELSSLFESNKSASSAERSTPPPLPVE